ncbi:hypothetical protein SVAN01_01235 [Stagonosporopsis vannaccii]|nr:hypothetical protein SVAN01_01235 [Stagonosporopsis vannaccii]
MSFPLNYCESFPSLAGGTPPDNKNEAGSSGINYFTMPFDPDDVYYGGLTIQHQNSISIKIPNTELGVPDTYIAPDGTVQTNTSVRNVVINLPQSENENDLPVLGRLFMSSAYIIVNQAAERFSVWQVNTGSKAHDLVAVDKENNMVGSSARTPPMGSSDAPLLPTSSVPPLLQDQGSKLSGAAIGGIVAGAVGGVIILGIVGVFLNRRRVSGGVVTGVPRNQSYRR